MSLNGNLSLTSNNRGYMTENTDHADVKIPPPVLVLVHVIAALLLDGLFPFPAIMPGPVLWLGILLVLAGLSIGFMGVRQLAAEHTTLDPHRPVSTLVTDGPYRFSRNPIYLGFTFILIGLPLALGTYWGLILSPLFVLLIGYLVIQHEESYLGRRFGEMYAAYKNQVRRWV